MVKKEDINNQASFCDLNSVRTLLFGEFKIYIECYFVRFSGKLVVQHHYLNFQN